MLAWGCARLFWEGQGHPGPMYCPSSRFSGYIAVVQINSQVSAEEPSLAESKLYGSWQRHFMGAQPKFIHTDAIVHHACTPASKLSENKNAKM